MKKYQWVLLMLLAAVAIHVQETIYRISFFDTFFSLKAQLFLQPIYFVAGWSLFWGFRKAQTFLIAWSVFIFFIVISRTLINLYVGEPWNLAVFLGLVLMVYGLFLTMQKENNPHLIFPGAGLLVLGLVYTVRLWPKAFLEEATLSSWMLYLLIGAVTIAVFENISRRAVFNKYFAWKTQAIMFPLNFIIDCSLFYGYRLAKPSFIFAWAVFTIYDILIRVINNKLLGEPFRLTHGVGMAIVIIGAALAYLGGLG